MKTQEHTKWKHPPAARDGPLREWVSHKLRDVDIGFEKARFMQGASALPRAPAHCLAFVEARQCIGVVLQKNRNDGIAANGIFRKDRSMHRCLEQYKM